MRKEVEVQRAILDYLKLTGIFVWRVNNVPVSSIQNGRRVFRKFSGVRGVADIIGILPGGRLLAIACKSEKGKPSPEQVDFGNRINAEGGLWFIARSVQDVIDGLARTPDDDGWTPEQIAASLRYRDSGTEDRLKAEGKI